MKKAKVVKMNIRTRCEVYEVAEKMLGELQPYVSKKLLAEIKERLMGFSPEMQVELADRVMDYYFTDTICPTECLSADNALVACCIRITGEWRNQAYKSDITSRSGTVLLQESRGDKECIEGS